MRNIEIKAGLLSLVICTGCTVVHHTQISDIEPKKGEPISIKISETTVDLKELSDLAKQIGKMTGSKGASQGGSILDTYTTLFQYGPRTGTPVYTEKYARLIPEMLQSQCQKGRLTNIVSVRETSSYPVVKGEIIRIEADCVK
jgi:hypothetical protein